LNVFFAWRYFKSKKSTNAINIIAWISVLAIAVGTASLIIVLSVFNGFEGLVKSLYADFYTDIRVSAVKGKSIFLSPEQINKLRKTDGVTQLSMVAEEKALLVNGDFQTIVFIKGVDANYANTNKLAEHIIRGKFETGNAASPKLVVGSGIENAAGIDVEKSVYPLTLYMPNKKAYTLTTLDALNAYNVMPTGTFMVQQDFDNKYVFSNLEFLKYMLDMKTDEFSSVEIKTNSNNADDTKKNIQSLLGKNFLVQTRYEQNQSLYTVMTVERWVIYGILSLILIVAAFNMIGALTMLVLEKQKDIAVLKAMGMNNSTIQKIFLSEGLLLAVLGGFGGMLLATIICFLQIKYKLIKLSGGTFLIDYYPVQIHIADYILVTATVLCIAIAAAWIPSKKASLQEFSLKS
jgi:lipoprotein-releasing system permease protein